MITEALRPDGNSNKNPRREGSMTENLYPDELAGRRSEPRSITDQYHCVEFQINTIGSYYQFKIWDLSAKGMCILVKEDSAVMSHIHVGDIIEMKYYPTQSSGAIEVIRTEIRHITKGEE